MMKANPSVIPCIAAWMISALLTAQDAKPSAPGNAAQPPTPKAENNGPSTKDLDSKPAAPPAKPAGLSGIIRYNAKAGRDPGGKDRNVTAASRANGQPDLKLVALSPGGSATTLLPTPTLWWHQSQPTAHGELQLSLSKLDASRPETVLIARLPAKPAGFQSVNLAHPDINPRLRKLEPGGRYQWSLSLVGRDQKSSVYTRLGLDPHPEVEKALRDLPDDPATLTALSASGNWHELFDRVASLARDHPDERSFAKNRDALLEQTGLSKLITKP